MLVQLVGFEASFGKKFLHGFDIPTARLDALLSLIRTLPYGITLDISV